MFPADLCAALDWVVLAAFCEVLHGSGAERLNILFIAIDYQNDWIGCLGGHPQVKTPNLDRLHGVRQRALPVAAMQSLTIEPAHGIAPVEHRHLRTRSGHPQRGIAKTNVTLPQTYTRAGRQERSHS